MMWQILMGTTAASRAPAGGPPPSTGHRYWRVNCYANQAGFGVAISVASLELRTSVSGSNVATGGTAIAGSFETGYEPAKAFDGNTATFWSKNGVGPYWIGYDFGFGNAVNIVEIAITARNDASFGQAPGCGYVEYSDDGVAWTPAWPFGAFSQATTGSTAIHTKPTIAPTTHQYWRLGLCSSHLAGTSNYAVSLAEVEMRATVGGADQTSGKTATASTSFDGSTQPSQALDDNLTTFWASNGLASEPDRYSWFKVDFGAAVAVAQIALTTRTNISFVTQYPLGISLWFSDDNVNWTLADCWSQAAAPTAENETFTYAISYVPSGNFALAFDNVFASMAGVYSLKKRVSAYSGPAVRVYDTFDASEQDVGFDANGRLNSFTVTGFARVTTWYDQSGNGLHLTQTTASRMPRLYAQGGPSFQPAVEFRSLEDNSLQSIPVLGTGLEIARPLVLLASAYESNIGFEMFFYVSNSDVHTTPYARWSLGRNSAYKIDSRWNGAVVTSAGGPAVPIKWQPIILDGASDPNNLRYYWGDDATFTDFANTASNTYGSAARIQLGANVANGEGASMMVSEALVAGAAPTETYANAFAEIENWNNFTDSGFDVANTAFDDLPYLTPIIGGGMVKRNPAYVGPAIRVYNATTFAEVDVNFDGNGFVTGTRPYGADTRLHTIYDQWGTDNFVVVGTPDATLIEEDGTYKCWRIQFNGGSYLATANTTSTPAAWVKDSCVWGIGLIRTASRGALYNVWGVESTSNFMDVGLWIDTTDAHVRMDGSSASDITGTHYTTNAARVANVLAPVVGIVGGQNNGLAICNGDEDTNTRIGITSPITWDAAKPMCIGGWTGLGSHCLEQVTEFHYFGRSDDAAGNTINLGSASVLNTRIKQVLV